MNNNDFDEQISIAIIGPLGPPQLNCLRSWKKRGYKVLYIYLGESKKSNKRLQSLADYVYDLHDIYKNEDDLLEECYKLCIKHSIQNITAVSYKHIGFLHKLKAKHSLSINVLGIDESLLEFVESKHQQYAVAKDCGFDMSETWELDSNNYNNVPEEAFPLVVRPDGTGGVTPSFKVEYIRNVEELRDRFDKIKSLHRPLIAQSFIDGRNVVAHGIRYKNDGEFVFQGFEVGCMLDGVAITINSIKIPDSIINSCKRFCSKMGIYGAFHFDLRHCSKSGKYFFLEINARLGGTTGKVFQLGFDEPGYLVDSYSSAPVDSYRYNACESKAVASNRYAIVQSVIKKMLGKTTVFDYPECGRLSYLFLMIKGVFFWKDELFSLRRLYSSYVYFMDRFK